MQQSRKRSAGATVVAVLAAGALALGTAGCSNSTKQADSSPTDQSSMPAAQATAALSSPDEASTSDPTAGMSPGTGTPTATSATDSPGAATGSAAATSSASLDGAAAEAQSKLAAVSGAGNATSDATVQAVSARSATGRASVRLKIANSQAKPADYAVQVQFLDASGKQVGTGYAITRQVPAGQSQQVVVFSQEEIKGPLTARIVKVQRS